MTTVIDSFSLEGRAAVVTGGSRGLGRGIARGLHEAGARVLLVARHEKKLASAARSLDPEGEGTAVACPGDITKPEDVDRMFARAREAFGRVDILVNSAGVNLRKPAVEYTPEEWDYVVDTNLKAAFFLSTKAARLMIDAGRGGKILHVASLASAVGLPTNIPPYTASKGGLALLVKALAGEWAVAGICVNAIGPGYFATALTAPLLEKPELRDALLARIPMRRFGAPADLAGAAVFLCSSASDYVTGQVLYVDGGYLSR
ncbi:MAG: SDR family NAD(P)-dependent oxidoreductase [Planctomycetota bacterium]|jgi:NAD(P)-dependent dehydrogenase (short-subunit alcohol dehydrogenase family)